MPSSLASFGLMRIALSQDELGDRIGAFLQPAIVGEAARLLSTLWSATKRTSRFEAEKVGSGDAPARSRASLPLLKILGETIG